MHTNNQSKSSSHINGGSRLAEEGEGSKPSHIYQSETTCSAPPTSLLHTAPPTFLPDSAPPPKGSRPSSARSLNFSTCSSEPRLDKHVLFRSKSQEKSDMKPAIGEKNEIVTGAPTWADRVKGLSQGNGNSNKAKQEIPFKSEKKESSQEPPKMVADEEELEEGWERVTRTRSRSASSSSKSSRSCQTGNHAHHIQRHTQKHVNHTHKHTECVKNSEQNGIKEKVEDIVSATLSPTESDSSSIEASNSPVFDSSEHPHVQEPARPDPVDDILASRENTITPNNSNCLSADSASKLNDVQLTANGVGVGNGDEDKVTLEELADNKQYTLDVKEDEEDEKKEIEEPILTHSQSSEVGCIFVCWYITDRQSSNEGGGDWNTPQRKSCIKHCLHFLYSC